MPISTPDLVLAPFQFAPIPPDSTVMRAETTWELAVLRARAWVAGVLACSVAATVIAAVPGASAAGTGQAVAFVSDRDGDPEIFRVEPDGSGLVQLTSNSAWDTDPSWSADGARLAFSSNRDGDDDIYVMGADGSSVINLTSADTGNDLQPDWSRDSSKIAFVRSGDIYVVPAAGGAAVKLGRGRSPAWSPVASRIVFARSDGDIYVMGGDGSDVRALTAGLDADFPEWSPDGRSIAFEAIDPNADETRIYVMRSDGSGLTALPGSSEDHSPSWSPDGTKLVFTNITLDANLVIAALDGSSRFTLVDDPAYDFLPAWSPCLGPGCAGPSPTATTTPTGSPTASPTDSASPTTTGPAPDRIATRTSLQYLRTKRRIKAVGRVTPPHPGMAARVILAKRRSGRWVRVATKMPLMDSEGRFTTRFRNPSRTVMCRLKARFDGDDDHLASQRILRFRC